MNIKTSVFIVMSSILIISTSCSKKPAPVVKNNYVQQIENFRDKKNINFKNSDESPLTGDAKKEFVGLKYFPVDTTYKVKATYEKIDSGNIFTMPSSGNLADIYQTVGKIHFTLHGNTYALEVYMNMTVKKEQGIIFLFIPFADNTNGGETYEGGRYMDIEPIEGTETMLDFNLCYNPYCSYNHDYSCPIPPAANHLNVNISAGEKKYD